MLNANGSNTSPLFNVNLSDLKKLNLRLARALLSNEVVAEELENADQMV